ncbi:hypothetical protein FHT44_005180 [Mycolicibacterium sp. BK634]|uniref:histone-like nucleoid-structuring protein Lsr2 n=1 Tax=Mycolicibacterium sp. BK634 TaxID=2587099 RepID=UPI0016180BEB|nr:Lsr2 family protein [Mycolicibacterium sp. BK634]MBB3752668.1 hypothetical protein [Mycolicibacterium sp. BK634]
MAEKVTRTLVDDMDGAETPSVETIPFGYKGVDYEIDLSAANQKKLEKALAPFIEKARKKKRTVIRPGAAAIGRPPAREPALLMQMREWGRDNGWPDISNRGRIPKDLEAAFRKANKGKSPTFSHA